MPGYLEIPIAIGDIMSQKELRRIDLKRSIHQMLHLITVTSYHEVRHDPLFGTDISEYDFENIYNMHALKDALQKSVLFSIRNNEKRLINVQVVLQIEQVEFTTKVHNRRVKTQIKMAIEGLLDKTNEPFRHEEMFFIGPLSY
jgi:phage baseplate assembly protein W